MQIRITRVESDRVLAEPPSGGRVVVSRSVVLQVALGVSLAAGEAVEEGDGGIGLRHDPAEQDERTGRTGSVLF